MSKRKNSKKNKRKLSGIKKFFLTYARQFLALLVFIVIVLVMAFGTGTKLSKSDPLAGVYKSYQKNEDPAIEELITNYYSAYETGDMELLQQIAYPISDAELSYVTFMGTQIEDYRNITIYTKRGADDTSYLVSVVVDYKFFDIDRTAQGLDFFYVQTGGDGSLYINNVYGSFNTENQEFETDPTIAAVIEEFEKQDDVLALQAEVQQNFNEAMMEDEALNYYVSVTLQNAMADWATAYKQGGYTAPTDAVELTEEDDTQLETEQTTETAAESGDTITVDGLEEGKEITLQDSVNIRAEASETAERISLAYIGEKITVVANYSSGWTKVTYNNKTGYVKTELLH